MAAFYLIFSFLSFILLLLFDSVSSFDTWITYVATITLIHAFVSVYAIKKNCGKWLCLPIIFLVCLFLFNWGQVWLLGFFKNYEWRHDWNKITIYPSSVYKNTVIVVYLFITSITLGVLTKIKKVAVVNVVNACFSEIALKKIRVMGCLILLLTLPFNIVENTLYFIASSKGGYLETFDLGIPDFVSVLSWMSIIGAVCVIIGTPQKRKLIFILFIVLYGFEMASGNRGNSVVAVLTIFLFYNLIYPVKINLKRLVTYTAAAFVALTVLATIKDYRSSQERSFEGFFGTMSEVTQNNILFQNMEEFGGAIAFPSIVNIYLEQTGNYLYGWTFISAWAGIFPNISGAVGRITNSGSMIYIIRDHIWGPYQSIAASCVSECLMNFGFYGVPIFAFFIGLFIGSVHVKMEEKKYTYSIIFYVAICHSIVFWARNSFNSTVRGVVWGALLIWIMMIIVKAKKSSKNSISTLNN